MSKNKTKLSVAIIDNIINNQKVYNVIMVAMMISYIFWLIMRGAQILTSLMAVPENFAILIWAGMSISLWLYVLLALVRPLLLLLEDKKNYKLLFLWIISFSLLVLPATYLFDGMKIGALAIVSVLSGFDNTAVNSSYALAKLFPFHPIVPASILIELIVGGTKASAVYGSVGMMSNILNASVACAMSGAAGLVLSRGKGGTLWASILGAVAIVLIISKVGNQEQGELVMMLHGISLFILWMQPFIWYSVLRKGLHKQYDKSFLLPPPSKIVLLISMVLIPILADASNYADAFLS